MQAFIRNRGVTKLPGFGDPALSRLNAERERTAPTGWRAVHTAKKQKLRRS